MSARGGLTLVEMMVAMLLTSILAAAIFGGLVFVSRGYRRDELAMSRAQVARQVFELVADDLVHQSGEVFPDVPLLERNGYFGTTKQFLSEKRRGINLIQYYVLSSNHPAQSLLLDYNEETRLDKDGWDFGAASRYINRVPASAGVPPPWGLVKSALLTPIPPQDPEVLHLGISVRKQLDPKALPEQILWTFWRKPRGRFPAGAILRSSLAAYTEFTPTARLVADIHLTNEWANLKLPKDTLLQPIEQIVDITLRNPGDVALPFEEPTFMMRRRFTAGL